MYDEKEPTVFKMIVHYVAWLVASMGIVLDMIFLREAVLSVLRAWQNAVVEAMKGDLLANTAKPGFIVQAWDTGIMVVLGVIAVGLAVWTEYWMRKGERQGLLYQRIAYIFGGIILVLAVAYGIDVLT